MTQEQGQALVSGGALDQCLRDLKTYCGGLETKVSERPSSALGTTWAELKALRDGGGLKAGQWYRITDYVTRTAAADTQSAGHQFDVLVLATSADVLSETAFAARHDGDTYFQNSKLEAWELRYCLDNDATRFGWADTGSSEDSGDAAAQPTGRGVIYQMKDEWGNECPYDFKNMMFMRRPLTGRAGLVMPAACKEEATYDAEAVNVIGVIAGQLGTSMSASNYGYWHSMGTGAAVLGETLTGDFVGYNLQTVEIDAEAYYMPVYTVNSKTIYCKCGAPVYLFTFHFRSGANSVDRSLTDSGINNNVIRPYLVSGKRNLNNIVFMMYSTSTYVVYGNSFGFNCYNNTFSQYTFLNTFGNYCYRNTFGNYVYYNTFGNHVYYNTFGNELYYNTFGNRVYYNTFGNRVYGNTFGNYVYNNTFGNGVNNILFGASFQSLGSYFYYNIIENGNQYIHIHCTATTSSSQLFRNITIAQGLNNSTEWKKIITDEVGQEYKTVYQDYRSKTVNFGEPEPDPEPDPESGGDGEENNNNEGTGGE